MANNKPASAYAGRSKEVNMNSTVSKKGNAMDELKVSVGGISKSQKDGVKTSGIQVRGGKAQTKGKMARGPMA
jgi:hypothetical protein